MVKEYAPLTVLVLALITVVFSVFGDDSMSRLHNLRASITAQEQENSVLRGKVSQLRGDVISLREDPRALEKAARNELGLSRPNEEIYIFEKKSPQRNR